MEKRIKTHPSQWAAFLDFAETYPQILTKKFDGANGRKKYIELWQEITEILNSMGFLKKTVDKWQKAVADWKSKVKAKVADINKGLAETGGGGPPPELNENERRLIAILGTTFISGIQTNKELGLVQKRKVSQATATQANPALANNNNNISILLPQDVPCRISPPPLWPISYDVNKDIDPTSSKSEANENIENETSENSVNKTDTQPLKVQEKQSTPKKRPWGCTTIATAKKKPSTNLTEMHKETLNVLNQINANIERVATSQERLAEAIEKLISNTI